MNEQYADSRNLRARARIYELFGTNDRDWSRWVFEQLDLPAASRILELGCGPGTLWAANATGIPTGWEITLTDLSLGMITEARHSLRHGEREFGFAVCDAQSVPFRDGSFDAVLANHMLYHVPYRPRAYSEIRRVLKPGGRLFATTNGAGHLRELADIVVKVKPEGFGAAAKETSRFGLETGKTQLAAWFAAVEVRRGDGELLVTDVEPLIEYVQSSARMRLNDHQLSEFREHARYRLSANGVIRITTSGGMFIAWKSETA